MSRLRFLAPLALCAMFLVLLPLASGQVPQTSIEVAGPSTGTVSVDEPQTFTFNVTNTSPGSSTPLDEQNFGRVIMQATGLPDGWSATVEPASFSLAPGESRRVEVTVVLAPAAKETTATLTMDATMNTRLQDLEDILGPAGFSQTATGSADLTLAKSEGITRNVLESLGYWVFVVIAALVAALILAGTLISNNRRVSVALSSPARHAKVAPGGRVALEVTVRNIGKHDDTVVFQVTPVSDGWAAFLPVAELELARGEEEQLHLVVIAPEDAAVGARQEVLVTAHSAQGPRHPASITFDAVVE